MHDFSERLAAQASLPAGCRQGRPRYFNAVNEWLPVFQQHFGVAVINRAMEARI